MVKFFFIRFRSDEVSFSHRLAYSIILNQFRFGKPVSVRSLSKLTRLHHHNTLPSVIADLVTLRLIDPPVKRRPLVPLCPPDGLAVPRATGGKDWWDTLAYVPCSLTEDFPPLTSVLFGVLGWLRSQRIRRTYQSSLATILGCHPNTVSVHLTRLERAGRIGWTQEIRSALTFTILEPVKPVPTVKPVEPTTEDKPQPIVKPAIEPTRPSEPPLVADPLTALAAQHGFVMDSPLWNDLERLQRAGADSNWLRKYHQVMGQMAEDATYYLPGRVARELMSEAAEDNSKSGKYPDKWFPLFNWKATEYGKRSGRFSFVA